jgi:hypothetical protein
MNRLAQQAATMTRTAPKQQNRRIGLVGASIEEIWGQRRHHQRHQREIGGEHGNGGEWESQKRPEPDRDRKNGNARGQRQIEGVMARQAGHGGAAFVGLAWLGA